MATDQWPSRPLGAREKRICKAVDAPIGKQIDQSQKGVTVSGVKLRLLGCRSILVFRFAFSPKLS
jgi:hypothetical protein